MEYGTRFFLLLRLFTTLLHGRALSEQSVSSGGEPLELRRLRGEELSEAGLERHQLAHQTGACGPGGRSLETTLERSAHFAGKVSELTLPSGDDCLMLLAKLLDGRLG